MPPPLRVAVCNLQAGVGTTRGYWHYATTLWRYVCPHDAAPIHEAAALLRASGVDLALLTEAEGPSRRSQGVDYVDLIAERAALPETAFFPTATSAVRTQGNAVCARHPVRTVQHAPLPGRLEPRFLSEAIVTVGGTALRVFVTHLELLRTVRARQIKAIAMRLRECDGPALLGGDFNVRDPAELAPIRAAGFREVPPRPTFPSWDPRHALDRLFVRPGVSMGSISTLDAARFSDHLPLVVELTLPET